jgi:hypothetical protein
MAMLSLLAEPAWPVRCTLEGWIGDALRGWGSLILTPQRPEVAERSSSYGPQPVQIDYAEVSGVQRNQLSRAPYLFDQPDSLFSVIIPNSLCGLSACCKTADGLCHAMRDATFAKPNRPFIIGAIECLPTVRLLFLEHPDRLIAARGHACSWHIAQLHPASAPD